MCDSRPPAKGSLIGKRLDATMQIRRLSCVVRPRASPRSPHESLTRGAVPDLDTSTPPRWGFSWAVTSAVVRSRGYGTVMSKFVLAMFVVAAIAVGLLVILVIGVFRVDEDGGGQDGAGQGVISRDGY